MANKDKEDRPGWLDQLLNVLIIASGVLAVALLLADNWIGLVAPAVMLGLKFGLLFVSTLAEFEPASQMVLIFFVAGIALFLVSAGIEHKAEIPIMNLASALLGTGIGTMIPKMKHARKPRPVGPGDPAGRRTKVKR